MLLDALLPPRPLAPEPPTAAQVCEAALLTGWLSDDEARWIRPAVPLHQRDRKD